MRSQVAFTGKPLVSTCREQHADQHGFTLQPPASAGSQPFAADQKPEESEGDEGPRLRRIIVASSVHGCGGIFYVPHVGEGNQILQVKPSKSMDMIRGHSID
jgi:hypothetical protein